MIFKIENITAGYKEPIVKNINFCLKEKEFVGVLGRNGQGKTTLLKAITGEIKRFSGSVFIDDEDITKISVKKGARYISVLPQKTIIPQGLSVLEILEMGLYPRENIFYSKTKENSEKIRTAAQKLKIERFLNEDCSHLSIGQQQMVLICRLLIQNTPIMLLDEPNAALDFSNSQSLFKNLKELVMNKNKAALLVLHDPETALRFCDRILILDNGEIKKDIDIKFCTEKEIETALRILYPQIKVRKNPYHTGYICFL